MRPKRKNHEPPKRSYRNYSFLATLMLLAIIIGASYYSSLPKVEHIPDNFTFQIRPWMAFVPQNTQYVGFVDFEEAFGSSGNSSLFGAQSVLQFYQLQLDIAPVDIVYSLNIQLPPSGFNDAAVSVGVARLHNDTFQRLLSKIALVNLPGSEYDGYHIYSLLILGDTSSKQKFTSMYTAIVEGSIVYSTDQHYAKYAVETILDQYSSKAPTLFDNSDVSRGVYTVGASEGGYIALFVGVFSTQFNNTRMIVKSIIPQNNGVLVSRSILFTNSDLAISEFGKAHEVYRDANSYRVLDQWLVVSYEYPFSKLKGELVGI